MSLHRMEINVPPENQVVRDVLRVLGIQKLFDQRLVADFLVVVKLFGRRSETGASRQVRYQASCLQNSSFSLPPKTEYIYDWSVYRVQDSGASS